MADVLILAHRDESAGLAYALRLVPAVRVLAPGDPLTALSYDVIIDGINPARLDPPELEWLSRARGKLRRHGAMLYGDLSVALASAAKAAPPRLLAMADGRDDHEPDPGRAA